MTSLLKSKRDNLIAIIIIGSISLLISGLYNLITNKQIYLGLFDLFVVGIGIVLIITLTKKNILRFASNVVLTAIFSLFIYLFIFGGFSMYEAMWLFVFPIICFQIEEGNRAFYWLGFFILSILTLSILYFINLINLRYDKVFLILFLSVFITVCTLNFFTHSIKRKAELIINAKDEIIRKDLKMAHIIQENILVNEGEDDEKINFQIYFRPMFEVGGDIYDVFQLRKDYYRILIADAAGHGVQAALITMIIKSDYDKLKYFDMPPNLVLKLFNNEFVGDKKGLTIFFNCAIVDIDLENNKLIYTAAGHPYQFYSDKSGVHLLKTNDFMVGIEGNKDFDMYTYDFSVNDKVLLFTDGIFEINKTNDAEIKVDTIEEIFKKSKNENIEKVLKSLKEEHSHWIEKGEITDDITLIGIERLI